MKRLVFSGWTLLFFAVQAGAGQSNPLTVPVKATLCEISASPAAFNHHLVEVHGIATHGFEDSGVYDPACSHPRPAIWMEFGGTQSTNTMYCCGFTPKPTRPRPLVIDGIGPPLVNDALFQEFIRRLHTTGSPQATSTVGATLRGIVFVRHIQWRNGAPPVWGGYGHMGCCILLVVTQVVALDPEPGVERPASPALH